MGQDKLSWEDGMRVWAVKKAREGMHPAEIASFFGKGLSTVQHWITTEKQSGVDALKRSYKKRQGKLDETSWQQLEHMLSESALTHGFEEDFWSLPRISMLITREFGVTYHDAHLSRIMRDRGFSWQVPIRRHPDSNQEEKRSWVNEELPRLEKKSSST